MLVGKLESAFLAPLSRYNTTTKVIAAQSNLINGGYLFSAYFLHSCVDAFGASLVMGVWGELPQGVRKRRVRVCLSAKKKRQSLGLGLALSSPHYPPYSTKPSLYLPLPHGKMSMSFSKCDPSCGKCLAWTGDLYGKRSYKAPTSALF